MLPLVLRQLEALQADLASIDPTGEVDVTDRVAALAVALRDVMAGAVAGSTTVETSDAAGLAIAAL